MKIALDAMGGDFGPPNLVAGAVMALHDYKQINKLYLVGDSTKIEDELHKHQCNDSRIEIVHSTQVVDMQIFPPSLAILSANLSTESTPM